MTPRALDDVALGRLGPDLSADVRAAHDAFAASVGAERTFDRALTAGARAPSIAVAFALGYQAAMHRLVPSLLPTELASLCATEGRGGHPRDIECGFAGGVVTGKKVWATLSPIADALFVLATRGERDGRKDFALVRVARDAARVAISPMPATPFVPEVPHAEIVFTAAPGVALPGDGFHDYVRAFRTIEDLHVVAAVGAHLVALARRLELPHAKSWPVLSALSALSAAADAAVDDPVAHLVIAGALPALMSAWTDLAAAAGDRAPDLSRDLPLLTIATRARDQRTAAAAARVARR